MERSADAALMRFQLIYGGRSVQAHTAGHCGYPGMVVVEDHVLMRFSGIIAWEKLLRGLTAAGYGGT